MVNKCVAPNCKTGLDGGNEHAISTLWIYNYVVVYKAVSRGTSDLQ